MILLRIQTLLNLHTHSTDFCYAYSLADLSILLLSLLWNLAFLLLCLHSFFLTCWNLLFFLLGISYLIFWLMAAIKKEEMFFTSVPLKPSPRLIILLWYYYTTSPKVKNFPFQPFWFTWILCLFLNYILLTYFSPKISSHSYSHP